MRISNVSVSPLTQVCVRHVTKALACAVVAIFTGQLVWSDDAESQRDRAISDRLTSGHSLPLPAQLPDGRRLRAIAFYQSQIDRILAEQNYSPVAIEKLRDAIAQQSSEIASDETSRLKSAVYWVRVLDDVLVSDDSEIDIEVDPLCESDIRRSLGNVNLALVPPRRPVGDLSLVPQLESNADGELFVTMSCKPGAPNKVRFSWQLRGRLAGPSIQYDLRIPRTLQTRIVLAMPAGREIESLDGVLKSRVGPPPDATLLESDEELRWYEIDAGGLASVRIRIRTMDDDLPVNEKAADGFVIRRTSMRYDAAPGGLQWTCRMSVQLGPALAFPPLLARATHITSVEFNGVEIPYDEVGTVPGVKQILFDPRVATGSVQGISSTVTVRGRSGPSDADGWNDLPFLQWNGGINASTGDDVQLWVTEPIKVVSWELPLGWKRAALESVHGDVTLLAANGPPLNRVSSEVPSWSRVRFSSALREGICKTELRLEISSDAIAASARVAVKLEPRHIEPICLLVEPGWVVESVSFAHSGRTVENPQTNRADGSLDLWPEAEDIDQTNVVLRVSGRKLLSIASGRRTIPPTWFVRARDFRGDFEAAIVPPPDLKWSGDTLVHPSRFEPSQFRAYAAFFGSLGSEALWFKSVAGRTPQVTLETPNVSFNARTHFDLALDRDEIVERIEIAIDSSGGRLKQLLVQTGPSHGRPPVQWSLSSDEGDASLVGFPKSDVSIGVDGSEYLIDVADKNIRQHRLVGRRRYPLLANQPIPLPGLPAASSQTSSVAIGVGLRITQKPADVLSVPMIWSRAGAQASISGIATSLGNFVPSQLDAPFTKLRYDATKQPLIAISAVESDPNVTLVWRDHIRVIASSRGTDRIESTYVVAPTSQLIQIEFEPDLQLASVTRDGIGVDLTTIQQRPIRLQPRGRQETIRVVYNRSQLENGWARQCRIPRISISGTVLNSEHELVSSSDAFVPHALLQTQATDRTRPSSVILRPGDSTMVIRRNIVLAVGWLIALTVFAVGWLVARRSPITIAIALIMIATLLFLWWPWRLALIGWLIIPLLSAAMLATSRSWSRDSVNGRDFGDTSVDKAGDAPSGDGSNDFSLQPVARSILLFVMPAVLAGSMVVGSIVMGQRPAEMLTGSERPATNVNLLIPVGDSGEIVGTMIYIPTDIYRELFQSRSAAVPQDVRFASANYRVKIDPRVLSGNSMQVEAEYLVRLLDSGQVKNLVRLPFAAERISRKRIELIDERDRMIQFSAESKDAVIATFPRGSEFRMRVTLLADTRQVGPWIRTELPVPPIAASELLVETEQQIDALRVGGTDGWLIPESDVRRRWTDRLGPTDLLEIDYRFEPEIEPESRRQLQSRYLVSAGHNSVTIDCELNPPEGIAAGEMLQFTVDSANLPAAVSGNWNLQSDDPYGLARRRLTVVSRQAEPGPVRLLWTQPLSATARERVIGPVSIRLPDASILGSSAVAPVAVALRSESDFHFARLIGNAVEPLSVDQFRADWSGYESGIDSAFVALADLPELTLQPDPWVSPTAQEKQHLHVSANRLELRYSASITPSRDTGYVYTLRYPSDLELIELFVNDRPLTSRPVTTGHQREVLLGSFQHSRPASIRATAVRTLEPGQKFSPPQISLFPAAPTSSVYEISRDESVVLTIVERPNVVLSSPQEHDDWLSQGWIHVSSWILDSESGAPSGRSVEPHSESLGVYETQLQSASFDCQQLVSLRRRSNGQWAMEAVIRFDQGRIADLIDVELPSEWCESLRLSPPLAHSAHPIPDSTRQVIRIRCDQTQLDRRSITLVGQFSSSEPSRTRVPSINVLGAGKRTVYLRVPDRLPAGESIQWLTNAVEPIKLPDSWLDQLSDDVPMSNYLAANPAWSIELSALQEINAEPIGFSRDAQVFAQQDGAMVVCRWDLFPGDLEHVDIRVPTSASLVAAWSAGRSVVFRQIESRVQSPNDRQPLGTYSTIRVPLSLSRLPQSVEILLQVPSSKLKQADYLPALVYIPVKKNWLAHYVPRRTQRSTSVDPTQTSIQLRAIDLARSVVESVESIDRISERPQDEISDWFELWLARYHSIAASVGHEPDLAARRVDAEPNINLRPRSDEQQFAQLDQRLVDFGWQYAIEIPPKNRLPVENDSLFPISQYDGFKINRVTRLDSSNRPYSIQSESAVNGGLRNIIVNLLTLALVAGAVLCTRPLHRLACPIVGHPAFWLGFTGIFGVAVAPVSVAAALVLVAITIPTFPPRKPRLSTR